MIAALLMSPRGAAFRSDTEPTTLSDGLQISARLPTSRILPGAQQQSIAVTITAPSGPEIAAARPPLSLAIVIDRSGSMHGAPIEHARASALAVLRQLEPRDAFAVVTYSSSSEIVLPMQRATEANKAAARAAIETIEDDGGTCISCGLEAAAQEVARTPVAGGLRRMLVISDGQANEGIDDRDELAQLAADKAARGVSISTVGVGLDFDEHTMRRLAEVGRGNYYFVEDTVGLAAMFVHELGNLSQTVASDVRLVIAPRPGVRIEEAYGYPMTRAGDRVVVPVADLRAGESRKVVLRVTLTGLPASGGPSPQGDSDPPDRNRSIRLGAEGAPFVVSQIDVGWHRVRDGAQGGAHAVAEVDVVADPAAVAASVDPATMQAVEQALSARALEEAAAAYDQDGVAGAQQVLERRAAAVRASARYLPPATVRALEAASTGAIEGFARAPAQAKKAASVKAYELAR